MAFWANPFRTPQAAVLLRLHTAQGTLGYGLQTNSTAKQQRGEHEDPTFTFQVPLQAAVERELTRHATQSKWSIGSCRVGGRHRSECRTGLLGPNEDQQKLKQNHLPIARAKDMLSVAAPHLWFCFLVLQTSKSGGRPLYSEFPHPATDILNVSGWPRPWRCSCLRPPCSTLSSRPAMWSWRRRPKCGR